SRRLERLAQHPLLAPFGELAEPVRELAEEDFEQRRNTDVVFAAGGGGITHGRSLGGAATAGKYGRRGRGNARTPQRASSAKESPNEPLPSPFAQLLVVTGTSVCFSCNGSTSAQRGKSDARSRRNANSEVRLFCFFITTSRISLRRAEKLFASRSYAIFKK